MNDEALGMMVASMVRGQSLCAVHFIARIVHLLPPRHICQTLDVNEGLIQRKSGCRRAIIEAGASRVYIQMMVSLFIMVFLFRRLSFFQS